MKFIRPVQDGDLSLIYSTWLKGQLHGNSWFKSIDQDCYFEGYKRVIDQRLATSVAVACCSESDPDVVLGYAVYSPDKKTLHWVYVKKAWRGFGIASSLVPPTIEQMSSLTRLGKLIMRRKRPDVVFNPFA